MVSLGKFSGYQLRELEESDHARLAEWIAADPSHSGILDPEFFTGQDPRVLVFALENGEKTVMYIRLARASRVAIQFPPPPETKKLKDLRWHRQELSDALMKGMAFLEIGLARAGCSEWIFETESDSLRLMVQRRMGFAPSPHEMVRRIPLSKEA